MVGGGNIFRGLAAASAGMDRSTADYMGMLATVMNGLALSDALEQAGAPTRVMSAIAMNEICEPYIRRRAIRHLEKGRVVIMVAGTGNPYFTTDTAATAARGRDQRPGHPEGHPGGRGVLGRSGAGARRQRYAQIGYTEVLADRLQALDATAVSLAMDNRMPIVVFDMTVDGNILRALRGEAIGT